MANGQLGNRIGFADKRATQGSSSVPHSTPTNYSSISSMRTRLAALGYTSATLDLMTENDMTYALRLADDSAGIR